MHLEQRSYAGKFFRPTPTIIAPEGMSAILVLTAWGQRSDLDPAIEDQLQSIVQTKSVEEIEESLRSLMNSLNGQVLNQANASEYVLALEAAVLVKKGPTLFWSAVGGPHIFLKYNETLHPLNYEFDWTFQKRDLSPLPAKALGIESNPSIRSGFVDIQDNTSLLLLSRSEVPAEFYHIKAWQQHELSSVLAAESPDMPFWLALISLESR